MESGAMSLVSRRRDLNHRADGSCTDDKLVIAVGSKSNDHGVKGLENCFQLKVSVARLERSHH